MNGRDTPWTLVVVVVLAVALAAWYLRDRLLPDTPLPMDAAPASAESSGANTPGPIHPLEPLDVGDGGDRRLVPLPALDDSDAYFLLALVELFGPDIEPLLADEGLIDKVVATIDNLPRERMAEKIRPVGRLSDPFRVETSGEDAPVYLSGENYRRYDLLVARVANADMSTLADTYRRFYPLFQQAYERLGYPDAYFNDRVVEVIDHLLATPEPAEPVELVRKHVLYEFADPDLAALSSGQKLLLRMGPANTQTVKSALRRLRAEITG